MDEARLSLCGGALTLMSVMDTSALLLPELVISSGVSTRAMRRGNMGDYKGSLWSFRGGSGREKQGVNALLQSRSLAKGRTSEEAQTRSIDKAPGRKDWAAWVQGHRSQCFRV